MKKSAIFVMTLLFGLAMLTAPAFAGPGCGKTDKASAETNSDDTKAIQANATDKAKAASCAKICGAEAAKACANKGFKTGEAPTGKANAQLANASGCPADAKCEDINLSIKGMTCTGCEGLITKAIMGLDGVYKVAAIDHKTGTAKVCIDPSKVEGTKLAQVVTGTGYEAAIVKAVAADTDVAKAGSATVTATEVKSDKKVDY